MPCLLLQRLQNKVVSFTGLLQRDGETGSPKATCVGLDWTPKLASSLAYEKEKIVYPIFLISHPFDSWVYVVSKGNSRRKKGASRSGYLKHTDVHNTLGKRRDPRLDKTAQCQVSKWFGGERCLPPVLTI